MDIGGYEFTVILDNLNSSERPTFYICNLYITWSQGGHLVYFVI